MVMKRKRYEQECNLLFAATCGVRTEDRTVSGVGGAISRNGGPSYFKKRSLILLV